MSYTKEDFIKERDEILAGPDLSESDPERYPSKEFCDMFIDQLPDDEEGEEQGFYNDSLDYWRFARGLLLDMDDGESEVYHTNVFEGHEYYESLKLKSYDRDTTRRSLP